MPSFSNHLLKMDLSIPFVRRIREISAGKGCEEVFDITKYGTCRAPKDLKNLSIGSCMEPSKSNARPSLEASSMPCQTKSEPAPLLRNAGSAPLV
jgi:hypothetical protein